MGVFVEAAGNASVRVDCLRRLAEWLRNRSPSAGPLTASEVATAIGSRRHAHEAIAWSLEAGVLQLVENVLHPVQSILESPCQVVGAVGQVVASAFSTPHASHPLSDLVSSPNDLRSIQEQQILSRRGQYRPEPPANPSFFAKSVDSRIAANADSRNTDSSNSRIASFGFSDAVSRIGEACVSSIPEGNTYETSNKILDLKEKKEEDQKEQNENTPRARARGPKVSRSEQLRKSVAQIVHDGSAVRLSLGEEVSQLKAYGMAVAYESALGEYLHRPALKYVKGRVAQGQPNYANWQRAVQVAEKVGLEYDVFVKSQFWVFDQWYSRAPKPQELGSTKSENSSFVRVQLFLDAVNQGKVSIASPVLSKQRQIVDTTSSRGRTRARTQVSSNTRFAYAEQTLRTLMKNYEATEEQVLRLFAKGQQASVYFDREWLKQNKIYQQLVAAGEI